MTRADRAVPHKLSRIEGETETPVEWPHVYVREQTTGPDRLAIAPREDGIGLLAELAEAIGPECYLLYVLVASRGPACGRYESPPLQPVDVRIFLDEFADALAHDARHQLWIGSTGGDGGLLVYDDHGLVYAYGPLAEFERVLETREFTPGSFAVPAPHTHHYHARYDAAVERLLARWEWVRTELRFEDSD